MLSELLKESNGTANIELGRPTLIALSRKVNEKIFSDTVSIQPTKQPLATVYGMRLNYVKPDNQDYDALLDHKTTTGQYKLGGSGLPAPSTTQLARSKFVYDDFVFETIVDGDYVTGLTTIDDYSRMVLSGKLRIVADGIDYTNDDQEVSECRFVLNRWSALVRSRKVKSPVTIELVQDMERQGLDANLAIEEMLSTMIADEINTDIISKLMCISTKATELNLVNDTTTYYRGREIIDKICTLAAEIQWWTSIPANYVVASYKVCGIIRASGQLDENGLIRGTNIKLLFDGRSSVDYVMVGTKYESDTDASDCSSGIFYSPYVDADGAGNFLVAVDTNGLQPVIGIVNRYALSAFPTYEQIEKSKSPQGDDWVALANSSRFVMLAPVVL